MKSYTETSIKSIRLHELYMRSLPKDMTYDKIQRFVDTCGIRHKDIRTHVGLSGQSIFVSFYNNEDAALALNYFSNRVVVDGKTLHVRYTFDYNDRDKPSAERTRGAGNGGQNRRMGGVTRVREAFSWVSANHVSLAGLPGLLSTTYPGPYFSSITTLGKCNEQHLECGFFTDQRHDDPDHLDQQNKPRDLLSSNHSTVNTSRDCSQPMTVVNTGDSVRTCKELSSLIKQYVNAKPKAKPSSSDTIIKPAKKSKKSKSKIRKKLDLTRSITETRAENVTSSPARVTPGIGRGFSSPLSRPGAKQHHRPRDLLSANHSTVNTSRDHSKPCAVISPMKCEVSPGPLTSPLKHPLTSPLKHPLTSPLKHPLTRLDKVKMPAGRGRGFAALSSDKMTNLSKY